MNKKTLFDIDTAINELKKEREEVEEELKKAQDERNNKEKKKELDFFNGKVEKDFFLVDPANVLAMGKIQNFEDSDKPLHLLNDFMRDNSDLKIVVDIDDETFEVWKEGVRIGKYSKEYYDRALSVAKAWKGCRKLDFYIQKEKNYPVLMACDDLGFVLAPRIEAGD
jgi:hypothetical protein